MGRNYWPLTAVPGHWERDLITGTLNQTAIATLVERTRYVMLVHLDGDHTAETVHDGLIKTMGTLPAHLRGSLTWDQGSGMASHKPQPSECVTYY